MTHELETEIDRALTAIRRSGAPSHVTLACDKSGKSSGAVLPNRAGEQPKPKSFLGPGDRATGRWIGGTAWACPGIQRDRGARCGMRTIILPIGIASWN